MKPSIRLSDFYTIFSETETDDGLVITGTLEPFTRLDQIRTTTATFPKQSGPRGSWSTSDWSEE